MTGKKLLTFIAAIYSVTCVSAFGQAFRTPEHSPPAAIQRPVPLTIMKRGSGSGTVSGIPEGAYCGTNCSSTLQFDTVVSLSAQPDSSNSIFAGWTGSCAGISSCVVRMDTPHFVNAVFVSILGQGGTGQNPTPVAPTPVQPTPRTQLQTDWFTRPIDTVLNAVNKRDSWSVMQVTANPFAAVLWNSGSSHLQLVQPASVWLDSRPWLAPLTGIFRRLTSIQFRGSMSLALVAKELKAPLYDSLSMERLARASFMESHDWQFVER